MKSMASFQSGSSQTVASPSKECSFDGRSELAYAGNGAEVLEFDISVTSYAPTAQKLQEQLMPDELNVPWTAERSRLSPSVSEERIGEHSVTVDG